MVEVNRRTVLSTALAGGTAGLAGCLDAFVDSDDNPDGSADDSDDASDETDTAGDDNSETSSGELEVTAVEIETTDSGCRGGEDEESYESSIDGETVELTGQLHTPNPCYIAVAEATVDGTTLSVAVDSEPDDGDGECIQCTGAIRYSAEITLSGEGIETVEVSHGERGADKPESTDIDTESGTGVSVDSFETTLTDCAQGDEQIAVEKEGEQLSVQGRIEASDPCHEAVLEGVTVDDETVRMRVDTESTLGDDEMCEQCLGHISYEALLTPDEETNIEDVRVEHSSGFSETVSVN